MIYYTLYLIFLKKNIDEKEDIATLVSYGDFHYDKDCCNMTRTNKDLSKLHIFISNEIIYIKNDVLHIILNKYF